MNLFLAECRMVFSTVAGLLSGRKVWLTVVKRTPSEWVDETRRGALPIALTELRQQYATESEGLERVRQRAQFALTAVIAAVGLSLADGQRVIGASGDSVWIALAWALGTAVVAFASLVFAGVVVARKVVGLADANALTGRSTSDAQRALLKKYQSAIDVTRHSRNGAITVFRDATLIALLGLALIFGAHVAATTAPSSADHIHVSFSPAPSDECSTSDD